MTPADRDALVAACLDAPADPAVRLVFADWLEERGDPAAGRLRWLVRLWDDAPRLFSGLPPRTTDDLERVDESLHLVDPTGCVRELWGCLCTRFARPSVQETGWELIPEPCRRAVAAAELHACSAAPPDVAQGCAVSARSSLRADTAAEGGGRPAFALVVMAASCHRLASHRLTSRVVWDTFEDFDLEPAGPRNNRRWAVVLAEHLFAAVPGFFD